MTGDAGVVAVGEPDSDQSDDDGVTGGRLRRRRTVAWIGLAAGLVVAVFIVLLALVGSPSSDTNRLPGNPAPALSGTELGSHRVVSLSQFAGKWVLVNFSASWCPGCRLEMPQLLAFSHAAPRYNAMILGVEYDATDASALRGYLASNHADWPAIQDPSASVDYGVGQIPASFLVNPEGIVVSYIPSGVNATEVESTITRYNHAASSPAGGS